MKKRIIVALMGSLFILSAWIFVPEKNEEPFTVNYFEDEVEVYELQAGEESIQEEVWNESDGVLDDVSRRNEKLEEGGGRNNVVHWRYSKESEYGNRGFVRISRERSGGVNEQAAGEEIESGNTWQSGEMGDVYSNLQSSEESSTTESVLWDYAETMEEQTETEGETNSERAEEVGVPLPSDERQEQPVSIQDQLRIALEQAGIGWWWPYAWAQAQQESRWNPNAVSPDGLDYGLFQFRLKSPDGTRIYWTEPESIFDVNAQIRVYTQRVAARLAAGLSIEETISRHFTSDYITEVNWQYVNDVLQHLR